MIASKPGTGETPVSSVAVAHHMASPHVPSPDGACRGPATSHPNRLECFGAKVASKKQHPMFATAEGAPAPTAACFAKACLVVLTVNRVQDLYKNRM